MASQYLGHQPLLEASLVGDLGIRGALVEDIDFQEAVVSSNVAWTHGAANQLGHTAVERHLTTLETRAASDQERLQPELIQLSKFKASYRVGRPERDFCPRIPKPHW